MTDRTKTEVGGSYTEDIGPTIDAPRPIWCTDRTFHRSDPQDVKADLEWPLLQEDWSSGWATFYSNHTANDAFGAPDLMQFTGTWQHDF